MTMDQVVTDYAKLVYSLVAKFKNYYDVEDLKQVGMMGLIKAFQHYDDSYDTKFSSFAYTYIKGEILKYIREDKSIKVNKELTRLAHHIDWAREVLSQRLMHTPTDAELCSFLEIDYETFREAENSKEFVRSLDYAVNEDSDDKNLSLYDSIGIDEISYRPEIQDLRTEVSNLDQDERKLLYERYYLDKTQQETSESLGLSQVGVSRKESKVLAKLKNRLT